MSELDSNTACPRCGQMAFKVAHVVCALPTFEIDVDGQPRRLNNEYFFPVLPRFCTICKYVEFEYADPKNQG